MSQIPYSQRCTPISRGPKASQQEECSLRKAPILEARGLTAKSSSDTFYHRSNPEEKGRVCWGPSPTSPNMEIWKVPCTPKQQLIFPDHGAQHLSSLIPCGP